MTKNSKKNSFLHGIGFEQLGNEHIPEPVMFEPFPIFSMDYLDCSAAGYKDGIQVAVSFVVCDSKKFWRIRKKSYICTNRVRHASRRTAHQGGTFILYAMSVTTYSNKPLSISDIITMLRDSRGLIFQNEDYAKNQLEIIGYFRIANYLRPMETDKVNHIFKPNSTFENALSLYYFDKKMRALLFTAIQSVEVGIRAIISHPIAMKYGPFWYLDSSLCVNQHLYQDNINSIKRETSRSKEDFVKEHFVKYPQSNLPSWKALEIVSFGTLSKVFSNLSDNSLKKSIARKLGLPQHKILENWLQSLSSLRNCIAHHARVWNRVFPSTPTLPTNVTGLWIENSSVDQSRLYAHLCCLEFLHNQIHPDNDFSEQLKELIYQHKNIDIHAMGFPSGWENEPLWK